ncbi:MAG: inositol monophosphatase [Phycisphaerales bacterium]|nr:inositol monophosphatase [Phycisphaerales bacterium]
MSTTPALGRPDPKAVAERLQEAMAFARDAGDIVLGYFGGGAYSVDVKRDGSEVTTADRNAEQRLRELIALRFPGDGVLGEEFGETASTTGWRWVLDPIDGTASFVHGVPLFGTLIACEFDGHTLAGVIHMPALGESVYASQGAGAWHVRSPGAEPVRARVSRVETLERAMACTTSFDYFRRAGAEPALQAVFETFGSTRGWSDCYAHVLCTTGRIDAVVEPVLHPWDIAPMQVIYPEAGGRTSDWRGNPGAYGANGVATNGLIHEAALALLRPFA